MSDSDEEEEKSDSTESDDDDETSGSSDSEDDDEVKDQLDLFLYHKSFFKITQISEVNCNKC